ncbi:MAG: hypothetical protein EZS28_012081 [Streblomastix strix]|uniref:Uncharacterized protein n=1 Tax=Streblomastix strix TaxID=222440 RepID=A0A5J4WC42_9EUKA|nr:MAG: hypothetical protein EZS28_012081 [Streblomastix strix]
MIRSFGPKFERLLYAFNDSHKKVTSITIHLNSPAIVSGVSEGQVRLWKLCRDSQQLIATMKEHRMDVIAVRITQDDLECASSGSDDYLQFKCVIFSASYTSYPSEANDQDCKLPRYTKEFLHKVYNFTYPNPQLQLSINDDQKIIASYIDYLSERLLNIDVHVGVNLKDWEGTMAGIKFDFRDGEYVLEQKLADDPNTQKKEEAIDSSKDEPNYNVLCKYPPKVVRSRKRPFIEEIKPVDVSNATQKDDI